MATPHQLSRPAPGPTAEPPLDRALVGRVRALRERDEIARAEAAVRERDERTVEQQVLLSEIPAPPFGEEARGDRMAQLMEDAGAEDVRKDEVGNVLGRVGPPGERPIVVAAHLDTVFPEDTDVSVRRDGERLIGPGISDDARGLAALLALADVIRRSGLEERIPLLVVATVGEEGVGDLRGVRHLFREGGPGRSTRAFVSLDGAGISRIVHRGLGSLRYRVTARGPGGHSWVDWGRPNPVHALGRLVAAWTDIALPGTPRTSLTVARWSGGTSINAIPSEAWVELEVRSEDPETLQSMDGKVRGLVDAARDGARNGRDGLSFRIESIGDRPAGETPADAPLVRAAVAATRAVGAEPRLAVSSTDANVPMDAGIPAVTLGAGGEAGEAHTESEWYRNDGGPDGIVRALLTLLLLESLDGE